MDTSDDIAQDPTVVNVEDDQVVVTIRGRHGTIEGWHEAREDLGLNRAGEAFDGIEILDEEPEFHDPEDEYPYGYSEITLGFDDFDTLNDARNHLYEKARERFDWGADGEVVQSFANRLPVGTEVSSNA